MEEDIEQAEWTKMTVAVTRTTQRNHLWEYTGLLTHESWLSTVWAHTGSILSGPPVAGWGLVNSSRQLFEQKSEHLIMGAKPSRVLFSTMSRVPPVPNVQAPCTIIEK